MEYSSINPFTNQTIRTFPIAEYIDLAKSEAAFQIWRKTTLQERIDKFLVLKNILHTERETIAATITTEMGKPLRESFYEIDKIISTIDFYCENAVAFLAPKAVKTAASESYVSYEPLGVLLAVMPWNFPFWQFFRFAIPAILAGNVSILKHAPNVPQCALLIEESFRKAGFPEFVCKNYFLSNEQVAALIATPIIKGVSFTGSVPTGSLIASLAAKNLKKHIMELGGNDAFIVCADADIDAAVEGAFKTRSINTGQACNGGKRFFIHHSIYPTFKEKLIVKLAAAKAGNPMEESTVFGPLARLDLADKVRQQVADSISGGATIAFIHPQTNDAPCFVAPTVLENVTPETVAFQQEIFGPVWSLIRFENLPEAISLANKSDFGLGCGIWTKDTAAVSPYIASIETGNVYLNDIVKSDARLPFGGIKNSGYGRELGEEGIKEFVNIKTVFIH